MKKTTAPFIVLLITLFTWQSYVEAASISSRVRVLESKVKSNAYKITKQNKTHKKQLAEVKKGFKDLEALKKQIKLLSKKQKHMMKKSKKTYTGASAEGKRDYSFP